MPAPSRDRHADPQGVARLERPYPFVGSGVVLVRGAIMLTPSLV